MGVIRMKNTMKQTILALAILSVCNTASIVFLSIRVASNEKKIVGISKDVASLATTMSDTAKNESETALNLYRFMKTVKDRVLRKHHVIE